MDFFFQAEDGIRDLTVTGVQTCALPICEADGFQPTRSHGDGEQRHTDALAGADQHVELTARGIDQLTLRGLRNLARQREQRSEERRVGKECRSWWSPDD